MSGARFTTGSTMRHVVVMTGTASVGLLALFLVDALNLFYISMLGVTELAAAIGFAGTVQFFMISLSIGLMIAGTATISRAIGADQLAEARQFSTSSLISAVLVMSVIAAGVWIFRVEALSLLGATGPALRVGADFLAIAVPSMPLLAIGMACGGTLRAIGEARQAMMITLSGGLLAAVIDPVLIFGLDLGVTGAAIGVVLVRGVIAGVGLWLVIARHNMLARPRLPAIIADLPTLSVIAGPAMLTQLSTPFGNAYLTGTVAAYGDGAVAGWAVIGRISALAFGGLFALAGAVGPIIGQNAGAGLPGRIVSTYRNALIFVTVYVLAAWLCVWLSADLIARGFGLDAEGRRILIAFANIGAGAFIFTGALFVTNAAFNNLGRPIWSTMCNWSRDAAAIPLLASALGGIGVASAVWIQGLAAMIVGTATVALCWCYLTRPAGPAGVAPPPSPPFASGRAALVMPEPLVSGDKKG